MLSISNTSDLIASLDDGLEGVLARRDEPNHAALGAALGSVTGAIELDQFDEGTQSAALKIADAIGEPEHIVFLLLDGFGMNFVDELPADAPIRDYIVLEMESLLPTSTGPNLMSLATGKWPGEHGNLGWDVYIPRLGERITPLEWSRTRDRLSLEKIDFAPNEMLLAPMIPFGLSGAYTQVVESRIAKSMTTKMYGQTRTRSFSYKRDPISRVIEVVQEAISQASGSSFTYVYWTEIDSIAHKNGVGHPMTRLAVSRAVALIEQLATALSGKARLVATADHGHLDSPDEVWETLTPSDPLSRFLKAVPAGEPRFMFFHCLTGKAQEFEELFLRRFGERFTLMRVAEAIDMGILGDPTSISDASRARIGDFVAISRGQWGIYASDTEAEKSMPSMHGGITVAETLVPLLVA